MEGIDAEGSALLAYVFNGLTAEQKSKSVEDAMKARIGKFMFDNGYRVVFGRWYLQAAPA